MAERVTRKYCTKCRKTLPIAKFYRYRSMACGRPTWRYSKLCRKHWHIYANWVRRHKQNKQGAPPQLSEKERDLRQRARHALGNAVYSGWVKKPSRCQRCKKHAKKVDLHGHHHKGYAQEYWRTVIWYCRSCHQLESA